MNEQNQVLIAAEHLVGNLWFNLDAVPVIAGRLEPDTMRMIVGGPPAMAYSEMCRLMRAQGEMLSAGSLEMNLRKQGFDFAWLAKLQSRIAVEGVDVLHNYAGEINNAADLHRVRMYCADADKQATQSDAKAEIVVAGLLSKLAEANKSASNVEHAGAVVSRVRQKLTLIQQGDYRWGANTGFKSLDKIFQMADGDLITLAGRPSQGKTSIWRQIFYHRAKEIVRSGDNGQVVMFSSDDTAEKTVLGLACTIAKVNAHRIKYNQADKHECAAVDIALAEIESLPIYVDESSNPNIDSIYYRCAMLNAQKPIRLAGQDYLGLVTVPSADNDLSKFRRAAEGCKGIGRTLGFPWLELAQLTKEVESRRDKWPTPSDLQYAGEAESDVCMMIMRPEHYISRGEDIDCDPQDREGVALINVGKNKQGEVGLVRMTFVKEFSMFADLAKVETRREYLNE
jgi:replicative DNA helicase